MKLDISLSESGEDASIFHDLRYANDFAGGNHTETVFEIHNVAGNSIILEGYQHDQDENGKYCKTWFPITDDFGIDGLRIKFRGSMENSEFLRMLELILEAEKINSMLSGYGGRHAIRE